MLLPYVFEHLGPTRRVGISLAFPYGLYCPFVDRCPSSRCRTRRTSRRLPYLRSIEGAAAPAPAARDVSRPCQQTVHAKGIHLRLLTCTLMSQGLFTMLTLCFSVSIGSFWSTPQCICSGLAPSAALVPWPSTQARTRLQTGMRWRGPPADRDALGCTVPSASSRAPAPGSASARCCAGPSSASGSSRARGFGGAGTSRAQGSGGAGSSRGPASWGPRCAQQQAGWARPGWLGQRQEAAGRRQPRSLAAAAGC